MCYISRFDDYTGKYGEANLAGVDQLRRGDADTAAGPDEGRASTGKPQQVALAKRASIGNKTAGYIAKASVTPAKAVLDRVHIRSL